MRPRGAPGGAPRPHLDVAAVDVHAADHAALRGDICPVDHLLPVVEIQSHSIVQPLESREGEGFAAASVAGMGSGGFTKPTASLPAPHSQ